jgi:hypothetical protein
MTSVNPRVTTFVGDEDDVQGVGAAEVNCGF